MSCTSTSDQRPFREVPFPSTLAEEDSDLRRACRTRLCCAFRFSQPLDALFRLRPSRPCFMPITPLGFQPSEVSPPRPRDPPLGGSFPSCRLSVTTDRSLVPAAAPGVCAVAESVPASAGVTRPPVVVPLLTFALSEVLRPPASTRPAGGEPPRTRSPLVGFGTVARGEPRFSVPALQSVKEPEVPPALSSELSLHEVPVLVASLTRRVSDRVPLRSVAPTDEGDCAPLPAKTQARKREKWGIPRRLCVIRPFRTFPQLTHNQEAAGSDQRSQATLLRPPPSETSS